MKKRINWHDIKLVGTTLFFVSLAILIYAFLQTIEANQELRQQNEVYKHNLVEIEKQYPNKEIILRLEKEEK